jgi:hypothetical protein
MKKIIFVLAFMMATTICAEGHNYHNQVSISVQTFYDELLPFGDWINTPEYGYVWRPYLDDPDFRPYSSGGNWVYTEFGWTWVSDYRWGWAAFHYGRWYFDDYLGWAWIPGYEWAPAWVTWGSYNDCWAWAPMGPNIQVNFNFEWDAPRFWWTFVPRQHFCSNNWNAYIYNSPVQITHITCITNVYNNNHYRNNNGNWFCGPRVRDVERHLNTRVRKMEVVDSDRPGNLPVGNNQVSMYRPGVTSGREDVRPAGYRDAENLKRDQKAQRTTVDPGTKRSSSPGTETRMSNQNVRNTGNSGMNSNYTNRSAYKERTPGSTDEIRSGSLYSNRNDPAREIARQTVTRGSNMDQRGNVQNQQPQQSSRGSSSRSSQPAQSSSSQRSGNR